MTIIKSSDGVTTVFNKGDKLQPGVVSPVHTHSDGTNPHCDVLYKNNNGQVAGKLKHISPAEGEYLNIIKGNK